MNHQSRKASPALDPKITQINTLVHLDDTPQPNNSSFDKVDGHGFAVFQSTPPGDRNSTDIWVNLDHSKFSTQQGVAAPNAAATANTTPEFDRSFHPGRSDSPFDDNEGMLSKHNAVPMTKVQKPTHTVAESWALGITHSNDSDDFNFVYAHLHCDTCGYYQALPRIVIGDAEYVKRMKYSEDYFGFEFILSFVYLVAHVSHLGKASNGHLPFLQVITYENQRLVKDDVVPVPRGHKTIVGVFHTSLHYAIAEVELKLRTITIFDGLFYDLSSWYNNVVQLLKKCDLIDFETLGVELRPDPKSKLICPGHCRGKDVVNGYDLVINSVTWRLIRGTFIVQSDGFNCGPIACLKVMELFSRLDESSAADCYAKARIRYVVCEEWDSMVKISDEHGSLIVNDTREEYPLDQGKADSSSEERGLDDDVLSHSSNVSAYQSDYEECIGDDDYNGLLFRPDCSSHCMTRQDKGSSPCHLGHERVLHARLTNIGTYVLFPSMCFHCGYYITDKEVTMTFLTAQLFASFGKKRISRKKFDDAASAIGKKVSLNIGISIIVLLGTRFTYQKNSATRVVG